MKHNHHAPAAQSGGRKLKGDVIFIAALLLLATLFGLLLWLFRTPGDTVVVTVDGKHYATFSLSEPLYHEIRTGENGEQLNVLVIKDGQAFVQHASCPDGICAAHRAISYHGQSIVCLPHRVVITVERGSSADQPDIIV